MDVTVSPARPAEDVTVSVKLWTYGVEVTRCLPRAEPHCLHNGWELNCIA